MKKLILSYAQGNPGALTFLMELLEQKNMDSLLPIMFKLEDCKSIRGTNLYVLWNDLCDKDVKNTEKLCSTVPNKILEDACSRQDYSGKELIAKYL